MAHKLATGILGPAGSDNDEKTFTLKLWIDESTPVIDSVMNATLKSKIAVVTTYLADDSVNADMTILAESQNKEISNSNESVLFSITSTKNNIVAISEDGVTWENVDTPSKLITIEKNYTTEVLQQE